MSIHDSWQRFNKTLLPEKKEIHSDLTIKDNKDADYRHTKK